jgi:branched-chain amino acid transport system ATP-binding protein
MIEPPLLEVVAIVAGYEPGLPIVRGANLSIRRGEIVVILGPNGAGKSTLVRAIVGLVPLHGGTVRFAGTDITTCPAHQMVRLGIAFVPQTENVFALMTVDDNLSLAAQLLPRATRSSRISATYALFPDLASKRRTPAGRLSGGQRQMLAIARAMVVEPRLLILDEASAGLSPLLVDTLFARLVEIRGLGMTVLLVEQNARAALAISDRAVFMVEGRNRYESAASVLMADYAKVAQIYFGDPPADASLGSPR